MPAGTTDSSTTSGPCPGYRPHLHSRAAQQCSWLHDGMHGCVEADQASTSSAGSAGLARSDSDAYSTCNNGTAHQSPSRHIHESAIAPGCRALTSSRGLIFVRIEFTAARRTRSVMHAGSPRTRRNCIERRPCGGANPTSSIISSSTESRRACSGDADLDESTVVYACPFPLPFPRLPKDSAGGVGASAGVIDAGAPEATSGAATAGTSAPGSPLSSTHAPGLSGMTGHPAVEDSRGFRCRKVTSVNADDEECIVEWPQVCRLHSPYMQGLSTGCSMVQEPVKYDSMTLQSEPLCRNGCRW